VLAHRIPERSFIQVLTKRVKPHYFSKTRLDNKTMPAQNPRLRALAAQVTRTVYHQGDRVVIWRGRHCGRSGFVVQSVGASLRVRLFALDGSPQIVQDYFDLQIVQDYWLASDGILHIVEDSPPVAVRKTSCCLVAESDSDSDSE
jgi:hypothetical protein